jgi:hypothetical protein
MAADTFDAEPMNVLRSRLADASFGVILSFTKTSQCQKDFHAASPLRRPKARQSHARRRLQNGRNALGF